MVCTGGDTKLPDRCLFRLHWLVEPKPLFAVLTVGSDAPGGLAFKSHFKRYTL